MPGEGQADPDQPRKIADAAQKARIWLGAAQRRQAEWSAATPPVRLRNLTWSKPACGDHFGELALPRETPDALDQIGVGVAITGDDLPEQRHELEAVEVIERLKKRGDFGREFETHKASARFEHAARLGERRIDASDVTQSEADRVKIDAAVGHREPLGIGAHPFDPRQNSLVESSGASDREHRLVDVANDGAAVRSPRSSKARQGAQSDIAGAAGDIEQALARTRLQPSHHLALPPAVDAGAHQIVHQIVALGDAVEDGADQRRLLVPPAPGGSRNRCAAACVFVTHRAGT